jgi:hypothetical protein
MASPIVGAGGTPANDCHFDPTPSPLGRTFLRLQATIRMLRRPTDPKDDLPINAAHEKIQARADGIRAEILARPVASLADVIDRLIVLGHQLDPSHEADHRRCWQALAPILLEAGINPGETGESPDRYADVFCEEGE